VNPQDTAAIVLILTLIAVTLGYAAACWLWPFRACRRCDGAGKHRSPSGRAFRYCHRCKGTGARLRLGRRVWNFVHRLHTEGR
jgi:DnaJ-class molecular chaperone